MKKQKLVPILGAMLLSLASCGGQSSSASQLPPSSSAESSSSSEVSSVSSASQAPSSSEQSSAPASSSESSVSSKPVDTHEYIQPDYTPSWPEKWDLKLRQPTNKLAEGFAFGVDCSSVLEVEEGGSKYHDAEGNERELFQLMADGGANYARIRLWVDPYDGEGNRYGGGTNDLARDIEIAKRAQKAGLKVLVDFHYSDSWVDPGKFFAPKAWSSMGYNDKRDALYAHTKESLIAFQEAGVKVSAVQLGNEINPGIAGVANSNYKRIAELIGGASDIAREIYPEVKTIVHYTNINNPAVIYTWLGYLAKYHASPDIVGLSYYPYWHGTLENLQEVMNHIATEFDSEVQIVETSWGFTDDYTTYSHNQFYSETLGVAGGYETSVQAQATELGDLIDALSKVPNGKGTGLFYWEPAWLSNEYSGWITKEGAYYNDTGKDWTKAKGMSRDALEQKYADDYGYSSWANQAWFDYDGNALSSLYTYRHIQEGDCFAEEVYGKLFENEKNVTVNLSADWALPAKVRAVTNFGAYRDVPVVWAESEVAAITKPGNYVVHGVAEGQDMTLYVRAEQNFIKDPDFELQGCTTEAGLRQDHWKLETTTGYKDFGDCHIEAKNEFSSEKGNQYLHWYSSSDFAFTLSQDLGEVPAGKYNFGFQMLASYYAGEASAKPYTEGKLIVTIDGVEKAFDILTSFQGHGAGIVTIDKSPIELAADSQVSIAFKVAGGPGAWGHADNFYFSAVIPS